jgi:hypothetical protein|tara:strand:+ start:641 stop:856 length:216 start_codon:yes stop_codon:yes gene_type:complete
MNEFEKSAKIDWSLHASISQPYRTNTLLWQHCDAMTAIETQDNLEEAITQMSEFPTAIEMLNSIGVNTNGK